MSSSTSPHSRAAPGDEHPQSAAVQRTALCAAVDVTKRFGGTVAIDRVSFDVQAGEVHALVGENGAGKSTLVNLLHGLFEPDEGHLLGDGERMTLKSPRDAELRGIAMIPQELELFPDLSIAENVFVGRRRPRNRLGLYDRGQLVAAAEEVFGMLGVSVDVRAPVRHVSFAACQLTSIARALLGEARVVIMDEPTAALTERETARLFAVIDGLRQRGVGIVYISHRMSEIEQIATRVTVMRDGKHVTTQPKDELATEELVRLMVGRPLSRLFSREHAPSDETALEVVGLTRSGEFHDVSFSVHRGEVVGLAGLIGAGRTEVAQTILGLRTAEAGEVRIMGAPVRFSGPHEAMAHGLAYVPEERRAQGLLLPQPIERNISLSSLAAITARGLVNRRQERRLAEDMFGRLDIRGGRPDTPVGRLSGGNQQKVVLAKALALAPEILILDEPTRGVDIGAKAEIYELIDGLAAQGNAILLISSELDEVLAMSDRVLVMYEGRLVATLTHDQATAEAVGAAAAGLAEVAAKTATLTGASS
jgi:rhamnose transport system ATP-binding protein